ncbi:MAG: 3'(2'),5'-bisphosphate nucleotidase CysQ [Prolixibacteraceae bacterium]|jgi:3'(2'), 5'-bisphosphate nucleotidase|nr:3'(2'),5'-bisphosphate nucleotidase CysQ [Prolixibacteraceae bacterium]MBT6006353.1 3'(2'),5'-bisphosphate nucleotidase CysQ [Prolixibacteraceae bacterium]MBT6766991.1 3'(2'),5'-bisphosphate nucleotidase CysQ [Prolixibacteraceae bacterium]MBT6997941.1 3'(2'),5'-bisphosphate nucleotidase CysQ [Prolixibacteraceae bacterium]MBT7396049.1 3'(2'),5'-bisphosphate nucleotidase CysQ [Prolixibacteraceae bacterium]
MEEGKLISVFELLVSAGNSILKVYNGNNFETELKSDNSPVTRADKSSGKIINDGLNQLFNTIPIINEENQIPNYEVREKWRQFFLVDPLDGTKEFIKKNGEFSINLALIEDNKPVEGWIYQPLLGKGWYCKKGGGIYEFDERLQFNRINQFETQSGNIRIVTSRSFFKKREIDLIDKIKKHYSVEIIHKGSSLKQIAIILGEADMYLKAGPCSEWDTAPGQLMVEEFGGTVFRIDNFQKLCYNKPILKNPHFVMLNKNLNTLGLLVS